MRDELIVIVLGDAKPSAEMERWLQTDEGQRELAAYRRILHAVDHLYGDAKLGERTVKSVAKAHRRSIHIPEHMLESVQRWMHTRDKLMHELDHFPNDEEVAMEMGLLEKSDMIAIRTAWSTNQPLDKSLERILRDATSEVRRISSIGYGSMPVSQQHFSDLAENVVYASLSTPVGRLFVAATRDGLVKISFGNNETAFVESLGRLKGNITKSAEKLAGVSAQLMAYFEGKRDRFDLPLDLRLTTPFQRQVLTATQDISAGQVVSYGELARRIGKPKASRAVGGALGRNPLPIVIPCHRIVTSSGGLGGYTGGVHVKQTLLELEGAW